MSLHSLDPRKINDNVNTKTKWKNWAKKPGNNGNLYAINLYMDNKYFKSLITWNVMKKWSDKFMIGPNVTNVGGWENGKFQKFFTKKIIKYLNSRKNPH